MLEFLITPQFNLFTIWDVNFKRIGHRYFSLTIILIITLIGSLLSVNPFKAITISIYWFRLLYGYSGISTTPPISPSRNSVAASRQLGSASYSISNRSIRHINRAVLGIALSIFRASRLEGVTLGASSIWILEADRRAVVARSCRRQARYPPTTLPVTARYSIRHRYCSTRVLIRNRTRARHGNTERLNKRHLEAAFRAEFIVVHSTFNPELVLLGIHTVIIVETDATRRILVTGIS